MVAGVLGGFAEYFNHDPVIWRVAFAVFLIATGLMPGVLIYLAAWILMPVAPEFAYRDVTPEPATQDTANEGSNDGQAV